MTENNPHPQYVGKAEAPKQAEFVLNPEQQQVVDVMKEGGEKLEKTVIDARKQAGNQLKELRGKELVKAGLKQTAIGLFGGKFVETVTGGIGGIVTGAISANKHKDVLSFKPEVASPPTSTEEGNWRQMFDQQFDKASARSWNNLNGSIKKQSAQMQVDQDAYFGAMFGKAVGIEASGIAYAAIAKNTDLPRLKWYDWVGGQLGLILPIRINPLNVVTFGGIRNTIRGLLQMGKKV